MDAAVDVVVAGAAGGDGDGARPWAVGRRRRRSWRQRSDHVWKEEGEKMLKMKR